MQSIARRVHDDDSRKRYESPGFRLPVMNYDCPSCNSSAIELFYKVESVPTSSSLLLSTQQEALEFPCGDIILGLCKECGFIYNLAFDVGLVTYSEQYESSQSFSHTFRSWHQWLAERLIERYEVHHKKVLEIGSGQGEFLKLLCNIGRNTGVGFDPAYKPSRSALADDDGTIAMIRELYGKEHVHHTADLVVCKMTLEHIAGVRSFIGQIRRSLGNSSDPIVFLQVPDTLRILQERAFWDIYYEHCSYFTMGSLGRLLTYLGFEIIHAERQYDNQYLLIEARLASESKGGGFRHRSRPGQAKVEIFGPADFVRPSEPIADSEQVGRLVERFAHKMAEARSYWHKYLNRCHANGARVVLWGADSKAVAFLTTMGMGNDFIEYVVDINPHKHDHFLAKSGQQIVSPQFLKGYQPDLVIVMNPIYNDEICAELKRMEVHVMVKTL